MNAEGLQAEIDQVFAKEASGKLTRVDEAMYVKDLFITVVAS